MNEIDFKEELTQIFSNDPVKWGKWVLVFVVFILIYIIRIVFKIDSKLDPRTKLDKKVEKAIKENHIIDAFIVSQEVNQEKNTCKGKYEFNINGKKYNYYAKFLENYPRRVLHLYYDKNPKKVFTNETYEPYAFRAIPLMALNLFPFILGGFLVWKFGLIN